MPNITVPDRTIPYNLEAEGSVLGAMQIDPSCIPDVALEMNAADCYLEKSRLIYNAIMALYDQGQPVDTVTIVNELDATGNLERAGGALTLANSIGIVPSALNAVQYARIVRETAMRRRLIESASQIARLAFDEAQDIGDVLSQAEGAVFKVRQGQRNDRLLSIHQVSRDVTKHYEDIEAGRIPAAVSTGYTDIDWYMTGWRRGELTLVAARPGIGKTSLLTAFALKSAKANYGTVFFSGEMSTEQLIKRMIQSAGIQNFPGSHSTPDWVGIYGEIAAIEGLPFWIDDTPNPSAMDIRAKCLRLASRQRIDHIFVDYVQLMRSGMNIRERYLEIGQICLTLKQVARELDCAVIAASQLNRAAEGNVPTLSDLKESGSQEEHADNVLFIHRDRETDKQHATFESDIIIAKQRNGPTGIVKLGWYPTKVTFVPIIKKEQLNVYATDGRPGRDWNA